MKTVKLILILSLTCYLTQAQEFNFAETMKGLGFVRSDAYYFRKMSEPWYACGGKRYTPVMIVQIADLTARSPKSARELYKCFESEEFTWMLLLPGQLRWSPSISTLIYLKGVKILGKERMELINNCEMAKNKVSVSGEGSCQQLVTEAYTQLRESINWSETGK